MTNPRRRHIIAVIDRSGSMTKIREDMQGGFREFLAEQENGVNPVGEVFENTLSLWQFDSRIENPLSFQLLSAGQTWKLVPRGSTRLNDAVGQATAAEGEKLAALPGGERPGLVVMLIVSDGEENDSREYTGPQVKEMLEHQQEKYGWKVIYLGTNQDAFKEAAKLGVSVNTALNYQPTGQSVSNAWKMSGGLITCASAGTRGWTYTDEDRDAADAA